jgi:chemotaxis protein methyltransferase CheR
MKAPSAQLGPEWLAEIGVWLEQRGLAFLLPRLSGIQGRLRQRMLELGHTRPEEYRVLLDRGAAAGREDGEDAWLIDALTVGETYFFRQAEQLRVVVDELIPETGIGDAAEAAPWLWCAGCANGSEAYSLAILLQARAAKFGAALKAPILATDISPFALARARQGVFNAWSLRGVAAPVVDEWFVRSGKEWTIHETCRSRVTFARHDLTRAEPPPGMPAKGFVVILCRNVLIYLPRDVQRLVVARLLSWLRPGGALVLGMSEPFLDLVDGPFDPRLARHMILRPVADAARPTPREPLPGKVGGRVEPAVAPPRSLARALPSGPPPTKPPVAPRSPLERIRDLADCGSWSQALALARRQSLSEDPALHYLHGTLATCMRLDQEATAAFRRTLYLQPSWALAWFRLGLLLRREEAGAALRCFSEARRQLSRLHDAEALSPFGELTASELQGLVSAAGRGQG